MYGLCFYLRRHLTFYIWRRILQYPYMRVCLGVPYYMATNLILTELSATRGPVWVVGYFVSLILTLGFAPLFELRYFSPAVVITLLNCDWKNFIPVDPKRLQSGQPFANNNKNRKMEEKCNGNNDNDDDNDDDSSPISDTDRSYVVLGFSLSIFACLCVLCVLMYVYLHYTFVGSDGDIARFML